jgi:cytochrome c oxidase cbb3-type subunit 2
MNRGPLLFLGLFVTMACSWLSFVLGPQLQIGSLGETNTVALANFMPEPYPLPTPGEAHQGAEIYRANGCVACHTEQVRPRVLGSDLDHGWGARRSLAEDYVFDQPVLLGDLRVGPDLANVGRRTYLKQILLRLYDPRIVAPGSIMPSYRYLFEKQRIGLAPSRNALTLPPALAPPPGAEIVPRPPALALAAYLLSLHQDGYLFEAPPPPPPPTNKPAMTNALAK